MGEGKSTDTKLGRVMDGDMLGRVVTVYELSCYVDALYISCGGIRGLVQGER